MELYGVERVTEPQERLCWCCLVPTVWANAGPIPISAANCYGTCDVTQGCSEMNLCVSVIFPTLFVTIALRWKRTQPCHTFLPQARAVMRYAGSQCFLHGAQW